MSQLDIPLQVQQKEKEKQIFIAVQQLQDLRYHLFFSENALIMPMTQGEAACKGLQRMCPNSNYSIGWYITHEMSRSRCEASLAYNWVW